MNNHELIESSLDQLGLPSEGRIVDQLARYASLVIEHNERTNVTGTKDEREFMIRHIIDSLAGATAFTNSETILDVGTGGGVPGIPLAIMFHVKHFCLCDSKRRKTDVVAAIAGELGLTNVEVITANAFELPNRYETITSRAYAKLEKLALLLKKIGTTNARLIAYKARRKSIDAELEKIPQTVYTSRVTAISVPFLAEERHLVELQKRE